MAIKEIYILRIKATFGPLRKSKSNIIIILALPFIGLALVPIIYAEGSLYGRFISDLLLQYPIILIFPLLFLSSVFVGKMNVVEYEHEFILSSNVRPSDFLLAKTLYDLTIALFLFFLPLIIPFIFSIVLMKLIFVFLFSSLLVILMISVILENSFKTLILFYNKNLVRLSLIAIILVFSFPLFYNLYPDYFPFWLNYISPVGCIQFLLKGNTIIIPSISLSIWLTISLLLLIKASRLNFIPYVQVVPQRTMFDISLSSQVRKQKYVLSKVGIFSLPLQLYPAPKNMTLFFVKESITRTLRFGDLYTLILTTFFLYLPYIFLQSQYSVFGSPYYYLNLSPAYFIIIFYPMIFSQLWFTEFSECIWLVKAYSRNFFSFSTGFFLWQLSITFPIVFIISILEFILRLSNLITSLMFSTPTLIVNSAFSVFHSFWLLKRGAFTPHMFFLGIIFYILLSTPIFSLFFIKELLTSSFDHILIIILTLYTLVASTVFIYKASKLFEEIEV